MSTLVLVARHGETDWNAERKWQGNTNVSLNESGKAQSEILAESLLTEKITSIYSSDLSRARETAEIVARKLNIDEVKVDKRLRERNLGALEGKKTEEISRITGIGRDELNIISMTGDASIEQLESFVGRISGAFDYIRRNEEGKCTLVIAHGGVMMALNLMLLGKPLTKRFTNGEILRLRYSMGWSNADISGSERDNAF